MSGKYEQDLFQCIKVYVPRSTALLLKEASKDLQTPVSRLIAIAVDNELDQGEVAFNYPVELPEGEYREYMYAREAGKMLDFISKCPTGIARDSLMLARRDLGIEDRDTFLGALRELLEKEMIEEFTPSMTKFNYAKGYTRLRVKGLDKPKTRFKRVEGRSQKGKRTVTSKDIG